MMTPATVSCPLLAKNTASSPSQSPDQSSCKMTTGFLSSTGRAPVWTSCPASSVPPHPSPRSVAPQTSARRIPPAPPLTSLPGRQLLDHVYEHAVRKPPPEGAGRAVRLLGLTQGRQGLH